jgi:hypothetical protein
VINFEKLVVVREKRIDPSTLLFTEKTRKWCRLPYPGHRDGCPNHCQACNTPSVEWERRIKSKHDEFVIVMADFDFQRYKDKRRFEHPAWSERQLGNSRHWQKSIKAILVMYIHSRYPYYDFLGAGSGIDGKPSMEAAGINVFGTLARNKIPFEKKPVNKVLMVALVMKKKGKVGGLRTGEL